MPSNIYSHVLKKFTCFLVLVLFVRNFMYLAINSLRPEMFSTCQTSYLSNWYIALKKASEGKMLVNGPTQLLAQAWYLKCSQMTIFPSNEQFYPCGNVKNWWPQDSSQTLHLFDLLSELLLLLLPPTTSSLVSVITVLQIK